jgi:ABC-type branched-subunit amino acid transport system ATPase component/ABC-type branched-subunit amino acid transport system permease subunit
MTRRRLAIVGALCAAAIAASFFANGYQLFVIATVALTAMVGVGLNVLLGLAGQISLGHAGFYALGAYACAILTTRLGWDFWIAFPAGGLLAAAAGALLAVPSLRVRGPYLAMVTIAFGFVVEQSAAELRELTGGWNGIMNIPRPSAFGYAFDELGLCVLSIALLGALVLAFSRLHDSDWGLAMRATRDAETASQSVGLNLVRVRSAAFVLSAFVAGIAGALFAALNNFISPESFPFFQSITFLLVVLVGGPGTMLGPLAGAVVVVLIPEMLGFLEEYRLLFFGVLLLGVLLVAPEGIMGGLEKRLFRRPPRRARADAGEAEAILLRAAAPASLRVEAVSVAFGGTRAVSEVSLAASAREVTSIIGPNGAGKTTLLNLIGGFYRADAGSVSLGEERLPAGRTYRIARLGVARTFQTTQLFPQMTVLENLLVASRRAHASEKRRSAEALLAFVGYQGDVERMARELPHVDRRLVEIARALALRPRLLMLDEPAAGLDDADTARLGGLLRRIAATGVAVLIIEHDMGLVMRISDHVVVLDAGRRIAEGRPQEVQASPEVRAAYLGEGQAKIERGEPRRAAGARVLEVKQGAAGYGALPVLSDIELDVGEGELVALLGANGAGKSTLMRAISGLHRPVQGRILLLGREIQLLAAHRVARSGITLVPEGRQVFPELSVEDNLLLGALALERRAAQAEVERLVRRFPLLQKLRRRRAGLLSGGEQQVLAIARGLAARPRLLLMDEPSLGLAPAIVEALYRTVAELRAEGMTLLLVDQMATLALSVADRGYLLRGGRIVGAGSAAELAADAALEKAYLGAAT